MAKTAKKTSAQQKPAVAPKKKAAAPAKNPGKKPAIKPVSSKKPVAAPVMKKAHVPEKKPEKVAEKQPEKAPERRPQSTFGGQRRPEPSLFRRAVEGRDRNKDGTMGEPEKKGIDRTRLGALQAKIFTPGMLDGEQRQALAHLVSEISMQANKPRLMRQQVQDELKKLAVAIKKHVGDAQVREAMLNDVDAFGAVVKGG